MEQPTALVTLRLVSRRYRSGGGEVLALKDLDLDIARNSKVAIMGPSGSGKSTLLQLIGGLDKPSTGTVTVAGQDITRLGDDALSTFRGRTIGFIFQTFNLQSHLTAIENVALPRILAGVKPAQASSEAAVLLGQVGLLEKSGRYPSELSGGEMQRVAIARALVGKPAIILADEPTANLDKDNAQNVLDLMSSLDLDNQALIIVTHDDRVASRFERIVRLEHGELTGSETQGVAL